MGTGDFALPCQRLPPRERDCDWRAERKSNPENGVQNSPQPRNSRTWCQLLRHVWMFTQEVCPTHVVHAVNAFPQAPTHDEKHNARDAVKRKHPDEEIDLGVLTPEYPCGVIHREQGYESEYVWDAFEDAQCRANSLLSRHIWWRGDCNRGVSAGLGALQVPEFQWIRWS